MPRWFSLCFLFGHRWEWIYVQEVFGGCNRRLRCWRCGFMPAYPFGGAERCDP